MEDTMDDETGGLLLKVDAIFPGPVTVKGPVGAADSPEAVGVAGQKVGGQDVKFPKDLDLERGGKLADFRGTRRGKDDLKGRHAG